MAGAAHSGHPRDEQGLSQPQQGQSGHNVQSFQLAIWHRQRERDTGQMRVISSRGGNQGVEMGMGPPLGKALLSIIVPVCK